MPSHLRTDAPDRSPSLLRRLGSRTVLVVAGVVAGAVVAGGVAVATIPSSNGGVITACVKKSGGAVRIIDAEAGARCASTERRVTWQSLTNRGTWSASATYAAGSLVQSGGSTYVAKRTAKGQAVTNTSFWGLFAAKGATGATGATGPQGPAGPSAVYSSMINIDVDAAPTVLPIAAASDQPYATVGGLLPLTLPAGSYVVTLTVMFEGGTSSGSYSCQTRYTTGATTTYGLAADGRPANSKWQSASAQDVVVLTGSTAVSVTCASVDAATPGKIYSATLTAQAVGAVNGTVTNTNDKLYG